MTTLFGVSILVTTYPENCKQTLFCNKHNVSNLILREPFFIKLSGVVWAGPYASAYQSLSGSYVVSQNI